MILEVISTIFKIQKPSVKDAYYLEQWFFITDLFHFLIKMTKNHSFCSDFMAEIKLV